MKDITDKAYELNISRRTALQIMASAGMSVALAASSAGTTAIEILKRPIPKTGEPLPAVGLGTYRAFDVGSGEAARAEVLEVIRLFVKVGGRVVDSSPMYGRAEEVVGALAAKLKVKKSLFAATKVWTTGREAGIRQMEASMRKMRRDPMDLMQVHNLVDLKTHMRTLRQWKEAGRIRYLGVTHYTTSAHDELERLIKTEDLDFVQFNYSVVTRAAETRLLPLAADYGVATIINRPFEQGGLFRATRQTPLPGFAAEFDCHSWAQFFLKYILSHPAVTCPIPATSKPKHLVDNMQAAFGKLPDPAARRRMVVIMEKL